MASNPLTAPTGPSPWGQPGRDVVPAGTPQIRGNALMPRPLAPPVLAAPTAPVSGEMEPGVQIPSALPPGITPHVAKEDRISERVPVPKRDFPEEEHKGLHEMMGEHFDNRGAQRFVHNLYSLGRRLHPDIEPRHMLETTRDAYHAVMHGFMGADHAGRTLATMARARQAKAKAEEAAGIRRLREAESGPKEQVA